ncbi:MAG: hypothetical protein ABI317_05495 [Gaiellales bacterium]
MGLYERLRSMRKAPLAIAAILSAPIFFSALMGSSLAIARPRIVTWTHKGKLIARFHAPAAGVEARIWLWALVPFAVMLAVGLLACLWRYGAFISCAAGVAIALGVTHRVPTWERHHTERWPRGIDNIPDKWSSDTVPRGAWEHQAAAAAYSTSHYAIGLAILIAGIYAIVLYRRMRSRARIALMAEANESPTTA